MIPKNVHFQHICHFLIMTQQNWRETKVSDIFLSPRVKLYGTTLLNLYYINTTNLVLVLALLLFFLCIIFFPFDLNDRPNMKLMLTVINCFIIFALVWVFRCVGRKWPIDIIESSCILNLGLLAVAISYILKSCNSQKAQAVIVNV